MIDHRFYVLFLLSLLLFLESVNGEKLQMVVVPAVFREWSRKNDDSDPFANRPSWTFPNNLNNEFESKGKHNPYNISVAVHYQKLNPEMPGYIKNKGTEGGVYLNYIVDNYHNFPDIVVFVHGHPQNHIIGWSDILTCIKANISYVSINNYMGVIDRTTNAWSRQGGFNDIYMEQCWRDVLKIIYDFQGQDDNKDSFSHLVPSTEPIMVSMYCCQQFAISRFQIQKRHLSVWKNLLRVVNQQDACHLGYPEFNKLYAAKKPEYADAVKNNLIPPEPFEGPGHFAGGAMEHLAHVIYGDYTLSSQKNKMVRDTKNSFIENCEPCNGDWGAKECKSEKKIV